MTDFHTHILPGIDDGSQSTEESLALLRMLGEQGVTRAVLTPHFIPTRDNPESFFRRRSEAYQTLVSALGEEKLPKLSLGAEIEYFPGIGSARGVLDMRIEGTKLLLVEMPEMRWSEYIVRDIEQLALSYFARPVLAHIERFYDRIEKRAYRRLIELGVLMQSNASFFINPKTKKKALTMLKRGEIHLLGSDCHSVKSRPPRLGEAYSVISDNLGKEKLREILDFSEKLFESPTPC